MDYPLKDCGKTINNKIFLFKCKEDNSYVCVKLIGTEENNAQIYLLNENGLIFNMDYNKFKERYEEIGEYTTNDIIKFKKDDKWYNGVIKVINTYLNQEPEIGVLGYTEDKETPYNEQIKCRYKLSDIKDNIKIMLSEYFLRNIKQYSSN